MNKKKNKCHAPFFISLVFLFSLVIALSNVSALTEANADYLIKQYSVFDIKRPCIYNGSQCSYAATCNVTINYLQGNGSALFNNTLMTNQGAFHNVTLTGADTKQAGWYLTYITCHDQGADGSETFYYEVTPTGAESNTSFFIILALVAAAVVIFGYAIRSEWFTFLGGSGFLVLGIYSMIYGWGNVSNQYTYMTSCILIGLGIIFTISSAYSLVESGGQTEYEEVEEVISE